MVIAADAGTKELSDRQSRSTRTRKAGCKIGAKRFSKEIPDDRDEPCPSPRRAAPTRGTRGEGRPKRFSKRRPQRPERALSLPRPGGPRPGDPAVKNHRLELPPE